jgi:hypothetical protein
VLKHLGSRPASSSRSPLSGGKVIFLAATTADLAAERDALARELTEMGHRVVPDRALPIVATDLEKIVREHLGDSDLAIHLVGDRYGFVPEDTDLSVVTLDTATRTCTSASGQRGTGLPRKRCSSVWIASLTSTRSSPFESPRMKCSESSGTISTRLAVTDVGDRPTRTTAGGSTSRTPTSALHEHR